MFSNRRKRTEQNKITYFNNKISTILSPNQDSVIPELQEIELWTIKDNNIYNTNSDNVGIGMENPVSNLDISGSVNTSNKYTINYISIAPPVGSVMAYTLANSPDGWLLCIGTAVSRTTYSALFNVIDVSFGAGDGVTTFNLPDYRGAFLRGTGSDSTGKYIGPTIDVSQNHATQTHTHIASSVVTDSGHSHNQTTINDDFNLSGGVPTGTTPSFPKSDNAGTRTWNNINNSTTGISVATTISNSTTFVNANETRPYNFGVYWIIKY